MSTQVRLPIFNASPWGGRPLVLVVELTHEHIEAGVHASCFRCPHALAVKAACERYGIALGEQEPIMVQSDSVSIWLASRRLYGGSLPPRVIDWIAGFDDTPEFSHPPQRYQLWLHQFCPEPFETRREAERFVRATGGLLAAGQAVP
jgi:hypothetical protein